MNKTKTSIIHSILTKGYFFVQFNGRQGWGQKEHLEAQNLIEDGLVYLTEYEVTRNGTNSYFIHPTFRKDA